MKEKKKKKATKIYKYLAIIRLVNQEIIKNPIDLFTILFLPIILVIILGYTLSNTTLAHLLGNTPSEMLGVTVPAVVNFSIAAITIKIISGKLIELKNSSILKGITCANVTKIEVFVVAYFYYYIVLLIEVLIAILVSYGLFFSTYKHWNKINIPYYFLGIMLTVLVNALFTLVITNFISNVSYIEPLSTAVLIPVGMLSGMIIPTSILNPIILNYARWFIPQTYSLIVCTKAFIGNIGSIEWYVWVGAALWIVIPILFYGGKKTFDHIQLKKT